LASLLAASSEDREAAAAAIVASLDVGETADEDRDLLTWDEVRAVKGSGIDVGSHADVHEALPRRPPAEVAAALRASRQRLEHELGPGRYPFSFPYGAWDPAARAAVAEAGFSSAATTDPGLNGAGADRFLLRRFLIGADDDRARLRASVSGLRALTFGRAPSPA
jgi:peptidoglycan/xylan/chitin deacetylase (PgdA/CDA1 family)